jgi:RNA polymerase sigma factor (sigma-70 family)
MEIAENHKLLAAYVEHRSEDAFCELVNRYLDLVYSTALRQVDGDVHLAEDVTQTVFVDLAQKAHRLSSDVMLGGWLHRDTCFVASKAMRSQRRRQTREKEAVEMNALNKTDGVLAQIAPMLDGAINELREDDRKAVLLRFYEGLDLRSVGEALGSSENAAQKRVGRALEQLEILLKRRGVTLSATALGAALATGVVAAAPIGLTTSVAGNALSVCGASGISCALWKVTTMAKLKIGLAGAAAIVSVGIPLAVQQASIIRSRSVIADLRQTVQELVTQNQSLSNRVAEVSLSQSAVNDQLLELMRLRSETGLFRSENKQLKLERDNLKRQLSAGSPSSGQGNDLRKPDESKLLTRAYRVEPKTALELMTRQIGANEGETIQQTWERFLHNNGVDVESPSATYLKEDGLILVRGSSERQDLVEKLIESIANMPRDQNAGTASPEAARLR